jgi:hypothetical protein
VAEREGLRREENLTQRSQRGSAEVTEKVIGRVEILRFAQDDKVRRGKLRKTNPRKIKPRKAKPRGRKYRAHTEHGLRGREAVC